MIHDFEKFEGTLHSRRYDVCICGAGAAGITLAKYLSAKGKKIVLLEGGDKEFSERSQHLYTGKAVGLPYVLDWWRLRYLGGTSNHWSGRCRPFVKEDFRERTINGLPGWPIPFEAMDNYLSAAKEILGLPLENTFTDAPGTQINSNIFEPDRFINSDPVRFGQKYYDFLAASTEIDTFLNANVTNIQLANNLTTINEVNIKSLTGKSDRVQATNYVLCMGAIENARILLCSNKQISSGIGNQTDMVGRCFMEHFNVEVGGFVANPDKWGQYTKMSYFTKPEYASLHNTPMANITCNVVTELKAYGRTKELKKMINEFACRYSLSDSLQFLYKHHCPGEGVITSLFEQFPDKSSRVYLDTIKDELDMNKVVIDWHMSENEKASIRQLATNFAKDFAASDLGRVKLQNFILDAKEEIKTEPHAHHLGTTRMAAHEKDGVVDTNSKVFGTTNLFIGGSSVFSTGGGGNPTMPLIQLVLRLGDYLLKP